MRLTKMEGLGNDYLFLNCLEHTPQNLSDLSRRLSDRHFGIGADGLICIKPGITGDFTMEMYNADGSRGTMCGNGIRCFGKYIYDKGLTSKRTLTIDTDAGPHDLELMISEGQVAMVSVDLKPATVGTELELSLPEESYRVIPVDVGNPHGVIFVSDLEQVPLEKIGGLLECHPSLPQRSNIEFVQILSPSQLALRVWERGSGITLACGTGACAAFAAAHSRGLCGRCTSVRLPGGVLWVEHAEYGLRLTGPAVTVFEADFPDSAL